MADQRGNYYTEMEYPSSNEPWVTKISRDPSSFYPAGADKALIEKQALANPINATFEQLSNLRAGSVQLSWGYGLEGQECLVPKEDCPLDKVGSTEPQHSMTHRWTLNRPARRCSAASPSRGSSSARRRRSWRTS